MTACPSCGTENPDGSKFCNECGTPHGVPLDRSPRNARSSRRCSATSSGSPPPPSPPTPKTSTRCSRPTSRWPGSRSRPTAGWWRSSSAMPSSGSSGFPPRTRTIPNVPCVRACGSARTPKNSTSVGGAPLKLRVGINTGEALVRLGIAAASGEGFLSGDSINTASRIQSVAPEMGVAVGLGTYEATAPVFDYDELEPATLKGKSEPVRVFHAKSPLARFGTDLTRTHDTPFIGREIDLALLKGIFDKTVAADSPQLVTVVGEPGLGKCRIVAELGAYIDTKPELITWRQGRCLPYGEGITFWALGEILKAHAGILESDPPDVAQTQARDGAPRRGGAPLVPPAPAPAARDRGDLHRRTRGAVHRVAAVPRAHRRARPHRARVRGSALGRRRDARVPRAPRRPCRGRAAARGRHRPSGAVRARIPTTRRSAQRHPDQPRPTRPKRRPRAWSRPCSRRP